MPRRDLGVMPGLLDRHFGNAGTGNDLTPEQARRQREEKRRLKRAHARAYDAIVAARPSAPPGRKGGK